MPDADDDEEQNEESESENMDVAAQMGFGSFGDQHRGKRRRYDSRTEDAVVDGGLGLGAGAGVETGMGKGMGKGKGKAKAKAGKGSGSNNLPLGTPRPRHENSVVGQEGDAENSSVERPTHMDPAAPGDDLGTEELAPTPMSGTTHPPRTTSGGEASLPDKPPVPRPVGKGQASTTAGTGTGKGTGNEAWRLRKGVPVANGDVAYYDVSFVEDPWFGLR